MSKTTLRGKGCPSSCHLAHTAVETYTPSHQVVLLRRPISKMRKAMVKKVEEERVHLATEAPATFHPVRVSLFVAEMASTLVAMASNLRLVLCFVHTGLWTTGPPFSC